MRKPGFRDKEFVGSRFWDPERQESTSDKAPGVLKWLTYGVTEKLAIACARGLLAMNLIPIVEFPLEAYPPARKLRPFGIMSKNRPEWFVIEQSASLANLVLIPLYDSLGEVRRTGRVLSEI